MYKKVNEIKKEHLGNYYYKNQNGEYKISVSETVHLSGDNLYTKKESPAQQAWEMLNSGKWLISAESKNVVHSYKFRIVYDRSVTYGHGYFSISEFLKTWRIATDEECIKALNVE